MVPKMVYLLFAQAHSNVVKLLYYNNSLEKFDEIEDIKTNLNTTKQLLQFPQHLINRHK